MNEKVLTAVKALDKKKAQDIKALKVEDLTIVTSDFVIAAGTSSTHVKSLADEVEFAMEQAGFTPRQVEGRATGWILLDYYDLIIHIFTPDQRENYNLEKLWADAEEVDLSDVLTAD